MQSHTYTGDWNAFASAEEAALVAQTLLRDAMQVRAGTLPALEGEVLFEKDGMVLSRNAFIFTTPNGIGFHYAKGDAITVECPEGASREELDLYLWGTVYGAVALLNELVPLHASAIVMDDCAIGFSAPSGGGKSTIAAGLAAKGNALICDDTLMLAPHSDDILAIPDGKPMKLWADMLELLGLEPAVPISAVPGKHFAQAPLRESQPRILSHLIFLEEGERFELKRVRGSAKLALISGGLYREELYLALHDEESHANLMLGLASQLEISILRRPKNTVSFQVANEEIQDLLQQIVSEQQD